jgi:putative superfamily III holin-X
MAAKQPQGSEPQAEALLGDLIRELSQLIRSELELAALRRGPELRRIGTELAAVLPALLAGVFGLAALSAAAGLALADALPAYAAALVVAAAFALGTAALVRLDHPRRLLRRLAGETGHGAGERAEHERSQSERALRRSAEQLVRTLSRDAVARELAAPVEEAGRLAGAAEREGGDILRDLVLALLAPGRAGFGLLEALAGRRERPPAPPETPPRRRSTASGGED